MSLNRFYISSLWLHLPVLYRPPAATDVLVQLFLLRRKQESGKKATGAPLYSYEFQSSITGFLPSISCCDNICWWLSIAAFLPLEDQNPIWYLNYFVPLHWSAPGLKIFQEHYCLSFLQTQTLLFSYKQTKENPNSSPHPLSKNII